MDNQRLNQDLILLKNGPYKNATWTFDAFKRPKFLKIFGAFKLDEQQFSLPYCNLLIPVPTNIYDPAGGGRFHFYQYVYVDEGLKVRRNLGGWRNLNRGYDHNLYAQDDLPQEAGWQWICYKNRLCGPRETVEGLLYSVQVFLYNDA